MGYNFVWTDELVMQFSNEKFWDYRSIECFKEMKIEEMNKVPKVENKINKMRTDYKFINGREIKEIGYDPENKICVIHYNHYKSGMTEYYHDVEQSDFELLKASSWAVKTAEIIFKNKIKSHGQTPRIR